MSGPVDVLAELDALIVIRASRAAKYGAPLTAIGDLQRAEATRNAVAELIEAAAELVNDQVHTYLDEPDYEPETSDAARARANDTWLQSASADDPAMSADDESAIEQMLAEPDCFDAWLDCPPSVAGLLSLILDRGLPCGTDERSDELRDMFETRMQSVRDDFSRWAQEPSRFQPAPVDAWRAGV